MSWAYRVARVSGIDIKIHVTFLLILLLGGMEWGRHHGAAGFVFGVVLMLALFTCVSLHELGQPGRAVLKIPVRDRGCRWRRRHAALPGVPARS
jgi:stage IV sporulation protein FB